MENLIQKLNVKSQPTVLLVNLPAELAPLTEMWASQTTVLQNLETTESVSFVLTFVQHQAQVSDMAAWLTTHTEGDAIVWLAYPKQSSKTYTCDFNRDTGWAALGQVGFEPVRQVAINADWSALRFRRVAFIKTMNRRSAITKAGKERIGQA